MNKEQAVRSFVKDKYQFLLSKSLSQQKLKDEFHRRYGNQFKRIENKDFALPVVRFLKIKQVSAHNIKTYIETLPLFKNLGSGVLDELRQIAYDKDFSTGLTAEDLEIIEGSDLAKLGRDGQKTLEELQKKIELASIEYLNLPSVLEYEEIPEPEFDPQFEETQQWWERFYLKSDPFKIKEGLQQIDESLYEEITVKTKPFQDILTALNKNQDHLFHSGFLLVGGYGYGKTTLIDYLSYILVQRNILPVMISAGPMDLPDSSSYAVRFHLALRDKLEEQLTKISNEKTNHLSSMDVIAQIRTLTSMVQKHRRDGVVVFMDDYHKHTNSYEQIYNFLGLQQLLKNELMRAGLSVGFVVSGTPQWKEELSRNSQLRGFLDGTPILLPEITPELVCEVFNQRIRAYCFDESPRRVKPEFVKRLFKELQLRTGYRDYLTEIITQLSNNNFAIIDTPVEIDQTTLNKIKGQLEQDEYLRTSLQKLVQTSRFRRYTKEQIAVCLGLLVQIWIHDGVTEADKLFDQNKSYFKELNECGLIQKRRNISDTDPPFSWVLNERFQKAISAIRDEYKLGINEYLLKIYAGKGYSPRAVEVAGHLSELDEASNFFSRTDLKVSKAALDNVQLALRLFDAVLSKTTIKPTAEDIERGWTAFTSLSEAFFEIDGSKNFFSTGGIFDLGDRWHFHWSDDEVLSELLTRYHDYNGKEGSEKSISGSLVLKQLQEVFPLLVNRLMSYTQDVSDNTFQGLFTRNVKHSAEELAIFSQAVENYTSTINKDHYGYIKKITDYLETRIRQFLYATSVLVFGEDYPTKMPASLHQYARRNLENRPRSTLFDNRYSGLTRAQLRSIFSDGNEIKNRICKYIQTGWIDNDWKVFLDAFVEANIATGHQRHELFSQAESNLYMNYCRRAEELTAGINDLTRQVIKNNSYLILCGEAVADPAEYFFRFILKPDGRAEFSGRTFNTDDLPMPLNNAGVFDHTLRPEAYETVRGLLKHKVEAARRNCLVHDLLDVEYLTNSYNVSYAEFIQSLSFAYWCAREIVVQPWFGSSILIKQAAA